LALRKPVCFNKHRYARELRCHVAQRQVLGMRRLEELVLSGQDLHRCGAPAAPPAAPSAVGRGGGAPGAHPAHPPNAQIAPELHPAPPLGGLARGAAWGAMPLWNPLNHPLGRGRGRGAAFPGRGAPPPPPGGGQQEAAAAAEPGHSWWPAGASAALTALSSLTVQRCCVTSLPPDLSDLRSLAALHLQNNMLGAGGLPV